MNLSRESDVWLIEEKLINTNRYRDSNPNPKTLTINPLT